MPKGPIAYLTGEYPKVSHTFIQREIETLRADGWDVEACTIRRAAPKDVVGEWQQQEQARTFSVLERAKNPAALVRAHLWAVKRAPKRWLSAAALAVRTCPPGFKEALWQLFYFLEAGVLAQHLREKGVQHIHNHFANSSATVAMLTSHMAEIPFSMTMHGPAIFYEPMKWRIDEKIARASFVACISHFCRSQAMYFSQPEHWDRLRIVHCGVEPEAYGKVVRVKRGKRVAFVGRLDPVKGVPLLIDAFAEVKKTHRDAELMIIGDGPKRADCEAQAAVLGLDGAVDFKGYQPSQAVAELLEEADLLVLPSFAEGVPVVLMEAMASRIPVIASRVAGVNELIDDGVSGYTIPAGDLDTLVAKMDHLLGDPELCEQMGEAGRAKVEAEFDLTVEGKWIGELFQTSLDGKLPKMLRPPEGSKTE